MGSSSNLFLKFRDLSLKRPELLGVLVQLSAQLVVLPQHDKRNEGRGNRQDREEDNNQLNHGQWASLGVLDPLFRC